MSSWGRSKNKKSKKQTVGDPDANTQSMVAYDNTRDINIVNLVVTNEMIELYLVSLCRDGISADELTNITNDPSTLLMKKLSVEHVSLNIELDDTRKSRTEVKKVCAMEVCGKWNLRLATRFGIASKISYVFVIMELLNAVISGKSENNDTSVTIKMINRQVFDTYKSALVKGSVALLKAKTDLGITDLAFAQESEFDLIATMYYVFSYVVGSNTRKIILAYTDFDRAREYYCKSAQQCADL